MQSLSLEATKIRMLIELVPLALTKKEHPIDPAPIPILRNRKNSQGLTAAGRRVFPMLLHLQEHGVFEKFSCENGFLKYIERVVHSLFKSHILQ